MVAKKKFKVHSKVVLWPGSTHSTGSTGSPQASSGQVAAWHFAYVDKKTSAELKEKYSKGAKGFGSLPVKATIGKTTWESSIFPDKRSGTYLLPLKIKVRHAEGIDAGDTIRFTLEIR